jgi:hypothetical protein
MGQQVAQLHDTYDDDDDDDEYYTHHVTFLYEYYTVTNVSMEFCNPGLKM